MMSLAINIIKRRRSRVCGWFSQQIASKWRRMAYRDKWERFVVLFCIRHILYFIKYTLREWTFSVGVHHICNSWETISCRSFAQLPVEFWVRGGCSCGIGLSRRGAIYNWSSSVFSLSCCFIFFGVSGARARRRKILWSNSFPHDRGPVKLSGWQARLILVRWLSGCLTNVFYEN